MNAIENIRNIVARNWQKQSLRARFSYLKTVLVRIFFQPPHYFTYQSTASENQLPKVYLEITNINYSRYLYLLIKFFSIAGYQVYLPANLFFFYQLKADRHTQHILKEKLVRFGQPAAAKVISKTQISSNYFAGLLSDKVAVNTYYLPISQHPLMYQGGHWNAPIAMPAKRKQSAFIIGRCTLEYEQIVKDGIFNVASRIATWQFLQQANSYFPLTNNDELHDFIHSNIDKKVLLADVTQLQISPVELRNTLTQFDFYLALSGQVMPLCHNIVEAMSVGCIPIVQSAYAQLLQPSLLDEQEAILYTDLAELPNVLERAFALDLATIERMRKAVNTYYNEYLTPTKVVQRVLDSEQIYLLAEHYSVEQLK
ncbi:MAG: hypothetical protein AB8G22_27290 [Saprospiraceae bacterium]